MDMSVSGTGVVKLSVGSLTAPFPEKPLPAVRMVMKKEEGEWQVVGKTRGKLRVAGPRSSEAPMAKDTNSPTPSTIVQDDSPTSYKNSNMSRPSRRRKNFNN